MSMKERRRRTAGHPCTFSYRAFGLGPGPVRVRVRVRVLGWSVVGYFFWWIRLYGKIRNEQMGLRPAALALHGHSA